MFPYFALRHTSVTLGNPDAVSRGLGPAAASDDSYGK